MNNPEEEASVFYRNDTEEMRVHEFLATVDEGKREIKDSEKDEARHDFVDSYTEGKSFASTRQEFRHLEWISAAQKVITPKRNIMRPVVLRSTEVAS